ADDGTRTHDLLHGKCARCSHLCASVRSSRLFPRLPVGRANVTEPERTPNLAILATPSCGTRDPAQGAVLGPRSLKQPGCRKKRRARADEHTRTPTASDSELTPSFGFPPASASRRRGR